MAASRSCRSSNAPSCSHFSPSLPLSSASPSPYAAVSTASASSLGTGKALNPRSSSVLVPLSLSLFDLVSLMIFSFFFLFQVAGAGNQCWQSDMGRQWEDAHGGIHRPDLCRGRNPASHPHQGNLDQEPWFL